MSEVSRGGTLITVYRADGPEGASMGVATRDSSKDLILR